MSVRSEIRRHRHPAYPNDRCGLTITVLTDEDGKVSFQRDGRRRRKCPHCKRVLKTQDLR